MYIPSTSNSILYLLLFFTEPTFAHTPPSAHPQSLTGPMSENEDDGQAKQHVPSMKPSRHVHGRRVSWSRDST